MKYSLLYAPTTFLAAVTVAVTPTKIPQEPNASAKNYDRAAKAFSGRRQNKCDSPDRTVWRHGHSKLAGFSSGGCNADPHRGATGPIAGVAAGFFKACQPKAPTP